MRNKITINEGEIQRILSLHQKAVLKETKSIVLEENTKTTYTTKKWNELELNTVMSGQGIRYAIPKGTVFSLTNEKGILRAKKALVSTALSGPGKEWSKGSETSVSFFCKQGKFYIKSNKGVNFYSPALAKALVNSICSVDPSKVVKDTDKDKDTYMKNSDKCLIRKPNKTGVGTMVVSYFYDGVSKCVYGKGSTGFNTEEECNKTCVKKINIGYDDGDNDEGTSDLTSGRGNRYTFDFDTIMKAINDTGKCGGFSGSSDGLSGTSGTAGTSGDGVIQNPLPINNRLSKDLYFKMISD